MDGSECVVHVSSRSLTLTLNALSVSLASHSVVCRLPYLSVLK
jgi:hypothetical protein